ncbi:MAG TPA: hypothetical protein VNQ79_16905 [Blastocatellia bacterium]|nr:hypothetical protein [Blastocatellia bacterium]
MSHIAMYSGVYEEIRGYAELLDKVLVELKGGTGLPHDEDRRKLGQFLTALNAPQKGDLTMRLIHILLRDNGEIDQSELAKIGERLETEDVDNSVIEPLERLAQSLEQEQATAMARMRMRG